MDEQRDVQGQDVKREAGSPREWKSEGEMQRFERELQQAFARVNAPESLAKFLQVATQAEAARQKSGKKLLWFKPRMNGREGRLSVLVMPRPQGWIGGAIAAVLVLGCFGALGGIHVRNEHRQAEAQREFAESQAITDRALEHVRAQMEKAGVSLDGEQ